MMETLDALGQRYGILPSAIVKERNPFVAYALDVAALRYGQAADEVAAMKIRQKYRNRGRGR